MAIAINFVFFKCRLTSRIKTVRAGELDCPQDNQRCKQARNLELRQV